MQNLKALTNEALISKTKSLVAEERKLTTAVLWHLFEIQRRRIFAEKGYGSLFEYAVKELAYSEAAAGRRIAAMRLLVEVPEIESALESGAVNLSTLCSVQSFAQRKEEPLSKLEKKNLVFALQGKSRRECEKELAALDPKATLPQEKERVITPTQTEIRFVADDSLMRKFQRIRELDGHVQNDPSYLELFHRMADHVLKKLDPLERSKPTPPAELNHLAKKCESKGSTSNSTLSSVAKQSLHPSSPSNFKSHRRFISTTLKRSVWKRDQGQCSYQSKEGKKCGSRFALEIDHILPLALGGLTEATNLRLLCRAHNQQQALVKLGPEIMQPFARH